MIRWFSRPMLDATRLFALFGDNGSETDGTPGAAASQANLWLPRAVDLLEFNHRRPSATGSGNSFQIRFNDGTSQLDTFDFANSDGTLKATTYSGVTFSAASDATPSQSAVLRHVLTGSASAAGRSAMVYQDSAGTAGLSTHVAGDGAFNMSVGAGGQSFFGIGSGGNADTSIESVAQCVWPATGTLSNFLVGYTSSSGTTYALHLRTDGSNTYQITGADLPAVTTPTLTTLDTTSVAVTADDLLSFGVERTAGSGTLFVCCVVFTFQES